jgi:hypothetical protein
MFRPDNFQTSQMYHTFQAATPTLGPDDVIIGKSGRPGGPRRISTSNACVECRRRKIRCDGLKPCGQCQWYQHPEACAYSKPTQRVVPSRKYDLIPVDIYQRAALTHGHRLVDKLQTQVDQYRAVFSRLYPGKYIESLNHLPREELISLAVSLPVPATPPSSDGDHMQPPGSIVFDQHKANRAESLEALEESQNEFPELDEEKHHKANVQGISDDVNGLSLVLDRQSSYVGVSSVNAALKVIFKVAPVARPFVAQSYNETAFPSRANTPPPQHANDADPDYTPPPDIGHKLIESYFAHVHVLMPMIDEDQFWHTWLYGERKDSPWLALLNIVLAIGSLASSTSDNEDHVAYFKRARAHLDLETFGSGSLLTLQALGLLSGYYLHWLNRPNEASCLMGATLRMATALGLHRECNESQARTPGPGREKDSSDIPIDVRRRTWWGLFILDTWASTTTGRPSLGRYGAAVTTQSPQIPQQLNNAQYLASLKLLPIIHNIAFCKLATQIQDHLAEHTLPSFEKLAAFDAELVKWYEDLPPMLRSARIIKTRPRSVSLPQSGRTGMRTPPSTTSSNRSHFDFSQPPERDISCPDFLKTPRAIMHWRYQNLRMLMHRPYLLATTLRRASNAALSQEEKMAVSRCRAMASQTIADINANCAESPISGWTGVWLMFQAVMVPLVSLFARLSTPGELMDQGRPLSPTGRSVAGSESAVSSAVAYNEYEDHWRGQIETAIGFFERMRPWSTAAAKSRDVVERLYQASQHVAEYQGHFVRPQAHQMPSLGPLGLSPGHYFSLDTSLHIAFSSPPTNNAPVHFSPSQHPLNRDGPAMPPNYWGLSPNGDARMNVFWDDMMWDSIPTAMTDDPRLGSHMHSQDFDWNLLNSQSVETGQSGWPYWPQGSHEVG